MDLGGFGCFLFWGRDCFVVFFLQGGGGVFLPSELELQKSYIEIRKTQANTVKHCLQGHIPFT